MTFNVLNYTLPEHNIVIKSQCPSASKKTHLIESKSKEGIIKRTTILVRFIIPSLLSYWSNRTIERMFL